MEKMWFCDNCSFKFVEKKQKNHDICPFCGSKQIKKTEDTDNIFPFIDKII